MLNIGRWAEGDMGSFNKGDGGCLINQVSTKYFKQETEGNNNFGPDNHMKS